MLLGYDGIKGYMIQEMQPEIWRRKSHFGGNLRKSRAWM